MDRIRYKTLLTAAVMASALPGLSACMGNEAKTSDESAAGEQTKQVSSQLQKPYLMNEQGEIIPEFPPEVLAAIKEDQRRQAHLSALADLEALYDPVTGKLRDASKLKDIQHEADNIAQALSKGAAK